MIKSQNAILMIEPSAAVSTQPTIDVLTRKMATALRFAQRDPNRRYRGFHICKCGVTSDNQDHFVNGMLTNSLAVHYLAYHRADVPQGELDKVAALDVSETEPTDAEMRGRAVYA